MSINKSKQVNINLNKTAFQLLKLEYISVGESVETWSNILHILCSTNAAFEELKIHSYNIGL